MKINKKMFKNLTNPVDVYEVEGKTVEVYFMNDTDYLAQYAGQGYFYQWSSDGNSYKLLVEKGYYETLDDLFLPEVNLMQVKLYEDLFKARKRIFLGMFLPIVLLTIGAVLVAYFVEEFNQYLTYVLIGGLVVLLLTNLFQSRFLKKKIEKLSLRYSRELEEHLGEERFERLAIKQRQYHDEYFNFDKEEVPDLVEQEPLVEQEVVKEEVKVVPAWVSGTQEEASEEVVEVKEAEEAVDDVSVLVEDEKEEVVEEVKKEKVAKEVKEVKETPKGELDLSVLTMDELKDFARSRKIVGFSTMRKSELVDALPKEYESLKVVELQALARLQRVPNFSTMRKDELISILKDGVILEVVAKEPKVEEVKEQEQRIQVVAEDGTVDLNVLVMDELKEFAKARKIVGFSTMRKVELVEKLPNNIHDLRLVELKALGREYNIANFSTMRKDELTEELIKGILVKKETDEVVEAEPEVIPVLKEDGSVDFNVLNLEELKVFAKERKAVGFSTMRKAELIEVLPTQIEDLRVNELRALARVKKISGFSTMRKDELIEAIQ